MSQQTNREKGIQKLKERIIFKSANDIDCAIALLLVDLFLPIKKEN